MTSVKRNNLRFYYFLFITAMTVLVSIIFTIALKVDYYQNNLFRYIFIFLLIKFTIQMIYLIFLLKRISKNEEEKNYDERERFIILKIASIGGFVAFFFSPSIYIFVFILPKYLSIAAISYALIIDTSINIAGVIYQKKI